jgi:hypothetical protein
MPLIDPTGNEQQYVPDKIRTVCMVHTDRNINCSALTYNTQTATDGTVRIAVIAALPSLR